MSPIAPARLSARPLEDPTSLLAAYRDAIGAQAMRDAYGPHWPRHRIDGEVWFEFWAEGALVSGAALVGWGSLLPEPAERVMWHSHGIWPAYQAAGYTPAVSRWLRAWAFEHSDCVAVMAKILDTNTRYVAWMAQHFGLPLASRGAGDQIGWEYAGHLSLPAPGGHFYALSRVWWERHEQASHGLPPPPEGYSAEVLAQLDREADEYRVEREARAQAAQA